MKRFGPDPRPWARLALLALPAAALLVGCARYGAVTHHNRGVFHYLNDKDCGRALEELRAAVELEPDYAGSYFFIGACYFGMGRVEDALEYFGRAHDLDRDNARYLAFLALGHLSVGDEELARRLLGRALEIGPGDENVLRIERIFRDAGAL